MIEVVPTPVSEAGSRVTGPAKVASALEQAESGKQLPQEMSATGLPTDSVDRAEALASALASINEFVKSIDRELRFTVDDELEKTVIKVIDRGSGEVIRQIPDDVFLELARNLKDDGELHLINALS